MYCQGGNKDPETGNGCFKLVKLFIYDISVYEKEVAKVSGLNINFCCFPVFCLFITHNPLLTLL